MPHETGLITTIVAGLVLAFVFGAIANRLRLPPLVGYLIAGIVVGPYSPGFVADASLAGQLAEIGVILLMFGVGLHFSLKDLLSVQAVAIPGALGQIVGAALLGLGLGLLLGWTVGAGLLFGLALSVASTVVLLKALQDRHLIDTKRGRIAVGWMIVEDIAMVLALVLIPAFAGLLGGTVAAPSDPFVSLVERLLRVDVGLWGVIGLTIVKLAAFVGVMLVGGRRLIPLILHYTAHTGSRELFRLAVLAVALGVAAGASYLFGVSLALGAFFAGMILSESELSHRAAQESLPLRDAFAVLFFVSVGMLFDPSILIRSPLPVLATLFIIVIGKSVLAFLIIVAFRRSASSALTIAVSLAQIGEFSFILAALGGSLGILPPEGRDLILAGALLSIVVNPLLLWGANRLRPWLDARSLAGHVATPPAEPALDGALSAEASALPGADATPLAAANDDTPHATMLSGHTVLIGYGRVGRVVAEGLKAAGTPFLVVEDADTRVAAARAAGFEVVVGNAAGHQQLELANIAGAQRLMIAIPNAFEAGQAADQARKFNPAIRIIARAHSEEEEAHLKHLGADTVIMGEREIGLGMLGILLGDRARGATAEMPTAKLAPAESIVASAIPAAAPPVLPDVAAEAAVEAEAEAAAEARAAAEAAYADDLEGIGLGPDQPPAAASPEVAPLPPESEVVALQARPPGADVAVAAREPIASEAAAVAAELAARAAVESTAAAEFEILEPSAAGLAVAESGLGGPAALVPAPEPELLSIATGAAMADPVPGAPSMVAPEAIELPHEPPSSASLPAVDSAAADAPAAPSQADGPLPADATMAEDNEPAPLVPLWPEADTAGADDAADPVVHPVPPVAPEDR